MHLDILSLGGTDPLSKGDWHCESSTFHGAFVYVQPLAIATVAVGKFV